MFDLAECLVEWRYARICLSAYVCVFVCVFVDIWDKAKCLHIPIIAQINYLYTTNGVHCSVFGVTEEERKNIKMFCQ